MRRLCTAGLLAGLCALTACSSSPGPAAGAHGTGSLGATTRATTGSVPAASAPRTAPSASQAAATGPAAPPAPRVTVTRTRTADGSLVTLATFSGPVRYVLHNGSGDPGAAAAGLVRAGPAITGAERSLLLAAFNGGFKLSAGAGGYEQEGHVISPLLRGLASLVIDPSGQARIGIWGHGVPAPGEAVYSVRQNLAPLVLHGRPTAAAADWGLWGATLGGGEYVARSALGQDGAGDLIYAGSMSATPADLAVALARHGALIAMELDINPEWVQLDVAGRPGGPLRAAVPGQDRPAGQYLDGWVRDFIAVEAAASAAPPSSPPPPTPPA